MGGESLAAEQQRIRTNPLVGQQAHQTFGNDAGHTFAQTQICQQLFACFAACEAQQFFPEHFVQCIVRWKADKPLGSKRLCKQFFTQILRFRLRPGFQVVPDF